MAKRTLLETIFFCAGQLLDEELQARKKAREEAREEAREKARKEAREEASKKPTQEPEPQAASGDSATGPKSQRPEPPDEGAPTEAPPADTTWAQPPAPGATCATDLGASVMDPPRCETWDFGGAADAGATIDGGDTPVDDAQVVQAAARRDDTGAPKSDAPRGRRRRWRGHRRRHQPAAPRSSRATPERESSSSEEELKTIVQQLFSAVDELRAEVEASRTRRPTTAEAGDIPRVVRKGYTTPGVVAIVPVPKDAPVEGEADAERLPGGLKENSPPKVPDPAQGEEEAACDKGVAAAAATTSAQDDEEGSGPPAWYLAIPIVERYRAENDDDDVINCSETYGLEPDDVYDHEREVWLPRPELDDDFVDHRLIEMEDEMEEEEFDPRDDPDWERSA